MTKDERLVKDSPHFIGEGAIYMQDYINFNEYFDANYVVNANRRVKSRHNNRYFDAAGVLTEYTRCLSAEDKSSRVDQDYIMQYIAQQTAFLPLNLYISTAPEGKSVHIAKLMGLFLAYRQMSR